MVDVGLGVFEGLGGLGGELVLEIVHGFGFGLGLFFVLFGCGCGLFAGLWGVLGFLVLRLGLGPLSFHSISLSLIQICPITFFYIRSLLLLILLTSLTRVLVSWAFWLLAEL